MPLLVPPNCSGVWEDSTAGAAPHCPTAPESVQEAAGSFSLLTSPFLGKKNARAHTQLFLHSKRSGLKMQLQAWRARVTDE